MCGGCVADDALVVVACEDELACAVWAAPPYRVVDGGVGFTAAAAAVGEAVRPRVFGAPLARDGDRLGAGWSYFAQGWWRPAVKLAGLEARPPYSLRHSFALHSLQAGVRSRTSPVSGATPTCRGRSPSTADGSGRWAPTLRSSEKRGLAAPIRHQPPTNLAQKAGRSVSFRTHQRIVRSPNAKPPMCAK
jgi:hypothetical protein